MKYFMQSLQDEDIQYEVVGFNPDQHQVTLKGPLATIVVSWADDDVSVYGYKLIKEDGSDAKLEELQAELQAGSQDG